MAGRPQRELEHSFAKEAEFMASVVLCTQMKYAVCEAVNSLSLYMFKQNLEGPCQGAVGKFPALREVLFDDVPGVSLLCGSMIPNKLEDSKGL